MSAQELLAALESQITHAEVKAMIETYKRMIKDALIQGHDNNAKRYSENLALMLGKLN